MNSTEFPVYNTDGQPVYYNVLEIQDMLSKAAKGNIRMGGDLICFRNTHKFKLQDVAIAYLQAVEAVREG